MHIIRFGTYLQIKTFSHVGNCVKYELNDIGIKPCDAKFYNDKEINVVYTQKMAINSYWVNDLYNIVDEISKFLQGNL